MDAVTEPGLGHALPAGGDLLERGVVGQLPDDRHLVERDRAVGRHGFGRVGRIQQLAIALRATAYDEVAEE